MPYPVSSQTLNASPMALAPGGQAPAVDTDGIIRNLSYSPRIIAKTAAYSVLARETGTYFTTTAATQAITFTLPVLVSGTAWVFEFFNGADQSMTVTAGTADTAVTFNDLAADSVAFSTASEKIGGHIIAFTDGTTLFVVAHGSQFNQHVTVTT